SLDLPCIRCRAVQCDEFGDAAAALLPNRPRDLATPAAQIEPVFPASRIYPVHRIGEEVSVGAQLVLSPEGLCTRRLRPESDCRSGGGCHGFPSLGTWNIVAPAMLPRETSILPARSASAGMDRDLIPNRYHPGSKYSH